MTKIFPPFKETKRRNRIQKDTNLLLSDIEKFVRSRLKQNRGDRIEFIAFFKPIKYRLLVGAHIAAPLTVSD